MERGFAFIAVLVLLGALLISGCTEPDEEAGKVKASATAWLETEQGSGQFPDGSPGEALRVWKEGEVFYWFVPITGPDGLYIGNIVTEDLEFTFPGQVQKYGEPRVRILNTTRDEAYQRMILESGYPAWQISRPILLAREGGLDWYSEVREGLKLLDELYIKTFTI